MRAGNSDPYFQGWGRVFDADGSARSRQFQLTPSNKQDHRIEAVETLADGTVLVVTASSNVSTDWAVNAVRFNAKGRQLGDRERLIDAIDVGLPSSSGNTAPASTWRSGATAATAGLARVSGASSRTAGLRAALRQER